MITTTIKNGGVLQIGDFICLGHSWGLEFGWYSGNGKSGTIQFVSPRNVIWAFGAYTAVINNPKAVLSNRDRKGFSLDHISKSFVRAHHGNRVVKITCPDDCFTGDDLQKYLEAKRVLTDMKFLKQKS